MFHTAFFLTHLFQYHYWPSSGPWYTGAIWSNIFVIAIVGPLGWLWSKSKFWPLRPIHQGLSHLHSKVDLLHSKHDAHAQKLDDLTASLADLHDKTDRLHRRLDHTQP